MIMTSRLTFKHSSKTAVIEMIEFQYINISNCDCCITVYVNDDDDDDDDCFWFHACYSPLSPSLML